MEVDADDGARLALLTSRGFGIDRREHVYELSTRRADTDVALLDGFGFRSAADVDPAALCALDEAVRRDVPGVGEWHNDLDTFRRETFGDPQFDPATYLVAVDGGTGGPGNTSRRCPASAGKHSWWWGNIHGGRDHFPGG
ncbi:hypothetical protein [Jiangella gansuensis]|uniref:hypothetical protein n=1 Tax=Jiangella gansuensis TaxID=281473 RepID=UPI0004B8CAAD|nr:hypothetical protein [Jiangella gansuensis]